MSTETAKETQPVAGGVAATSDIPPAGLQIRILCVVHARYRCGGCRRLACMSCGIVPITAETGQLVADISLWCRECRGYG